MNVLNEVGIILVSCVALYFIILEGENRKEWGKVKSIVLFASFAFSLYYIPYGIWKLFGSIEGSIGMYIFGIVYFVIFAIMYPYIEKKAERERERNVHK